MSDDLSVFIVKTSNTGYSRFEFLQAKTLCGISPGGVFQIGELFTISGSKATSQAGLDHYSSESVLSGVFCSCRADCPGGYYLNTGTRLVVSRKSLC